MVTIVEEQEIRQLIGFDEKALRQVERSFDWATNREAEIPPVMHYSLPDGDVDVKGAYVPSVSQFAIKVASGFYENWKLGLPSSSGLMLVINANTGICDAVLLDNGYLTNLRTGLAGAVAARHLAPNDIDTVGVVGSGAQARFQVRAIQMVRKFQRLMVFGIDTKEMDNYITEMATCIDASIVAAESVEQLVHESQCVVTTTPSKTPLIDASMLHQTLHITAMGSDLPGKQELNANVLAAVDLVCCDRLAQAVKIGELQHAVDIERMSPVELGQIVAGHHAGRTASSQTTVCDLSGIGTQDTAIAVEVLRRIANT